MVIFQFSDVHHLVISYPSILPIAYLNLMRQYLNINLHLFCFCCIINIENTPQAWIGSDKSFTYDFVYDTTARQEEVYEDTVKPLVEGCFEGKRGNIRYLFFVSLRSCRRYLREGAHIEHHEPKSSALEIITYSCDCSTKHLYFSLRTLSGLAAGIEPYFCFQL